MGRIKKYKKQKKEYPTEKSLDGSEGEEDAKEEQYNKTKHKTTSSLEKIGCLEKEIKQICSRISNLNQCVNMDSEEDEV